MSSTAIVYVNGREILDSCGNPTIEATVVLENECVGQASVPSGRSKAADEAVELRDGDMARYGGMGVLKAVENINERIAEAILGLDACDQESVDREMINLDGSPNKGNLGANAILAVSMAVAKAAAEACKLPLFRYLGGVSAHVMPVPMMNMLDGGRRADNNVDFQEFLIQPWGAPTFREALRWSAEIQQTLASILSERGYSVSVGDEGGFAPKLKNNDEAFELMAMAVEKAGYKLGEQIFFALYPAMSELFGEAKAKGKVGYCLFKSDPDRILGSDEVIDCWLALCRKWPLRSLEDGLAEDDRDGWKKLTASLGGKIQLVADDLCSTLMNRLGRGFREGIANSILVKTDQIGCLTETLNTINLAMRNGYTTVVSHGSGETEDTTIADIAVATNAGQIKAGGVRRSDRVAKYNQLLRIEEHLGDEAVFGGTFWNK